ncbi:MAG: haloacid dehalogenase [Treponema sp. CETP13]|nr:MAG: haloacid dehalogenase [Treponema sp. CETP13]
MTIYRIPPEVTAIIFDIDSTLYTNKDYAFEQNDVQIRRFAKQNNMSDDKARNLINSYRKEWSSLHNNATISLANTLVDLGIPIEESIKWRKELLQPEKYLQEDLQLQETLKALSNKYQLYCLTNNPVSIGRRTLVTLGIDGFISEIVGLDTTHLSKPALKPFETILQRAKCPVENCLAVGDRYSIDIEIPLEMGMGGILVDSVKDVYTLPQFTIFLNNRES